MSEARALIRIAVALALAACTAPPEAEIPISAAAAARPLPQLVATEQFTQTLVASAPAAAQVGEQRDALAASADGLRARAAGLSDPVLDPEARARLTAAAQSTN